MSQLSSLELALSQTWLLLVAEVAQATSRDELERRCLRALAQIVPGAEATLRWAEQGASELVDGDSGQLACIPLRAAGALCGWIELRPGVLSPEQEQALAMLAAVAGPTKRALAAAAPSPETALRQALAADLARLSRSLHLDTLLEQTSAAVTRVCEAAGVCVVLRYKNSDWLELASIAWQGHYHRPSSYWSGDAGLSSLVMASGEPLYVTDYDAECERRKLQPIFDGELSPTKAWFGAPLRQGKTTIGVLSMSLPDEGSSFTPLQRELFLTIAQEAGPLISNALRFRQAERQAHQLAALNQIVRTINSSLDPEQVPALIIEQAHKLGEAEEGTLLLLDEQSGELVFTYASGPAGQQLLGTRLPPGKGIAGFVVTSAQSQIVNDTATDGRFYRDVDGGTGFTTRSLVAVPLRGIDGIKGVIEVVNRRDNAPFTDEDRILLEAVADQAVIALENARRFARIDQALARRAQELDRTNDQLRKILRVSHALRAERRLDDMLRQIADAVVESAGFRSAVIALVQRERTAEPYLRRVVAAGPAAAALDRLRNTRASIAGLQAILRPEYRRGSLTYLIDHHQDDYAKLWGGPDLIGAAGSEQGDRPGAWHRGDVLFSLLRDSRGELLGTLRVLDPEDGMHPSHEQVQILEIFANQAAVAIESVRLYSEQQHSLQSMMALNGLGMAINSTLRSPDQIYQLTASGMVEMTEARWAVVLLCDESGDRLTVGFHSETAPHDREIERLANDAIAGRRPATELRGSAHEARIAIPLRATRRVLGAICVGYDEGLPPPADLETLSLFANQAAVAVESVELLSAVRQGRDRLASIMASTHEGLLLLNHTGQVVVANKAFHSLSGAEEWASPAPTPEALAGLDATALLARWQGAADFAATELEQLTRGLESVASGTATNAAGELNASGAGPRCLFWSVLRATGEGPIGDDASDGRWPVLLTLRDVSAEKETERLRQDLSSMIVHDLRSPLTSIMTSIDMFFRGVTGEVSSMQREILTIAYASTQHLLNMVNLLLDISRLEGGRMPLDRVPLAVGPLVQRALARMAIIAQNGNISVEPQIDDENRLIYADGELVLRVLQNLVDNALKFSPKGGRVTLEVVEHSLEGPASPQRVAAAGQTSVSVDARRLVRFAVHDQGVGIRPQDIEKIFQKFGQAGDRRNSGSGLGLTFCKLVVEAHGGRIWVESTPGMGSSFFFTLPAAEMTMAGEAVTGQGII